MRQATLIAAYGDKPPELEAFLLEAQGVVARELGDAFAPYTLGQTHATLLGVNGLPDAPLENRFLFEHTGRRERMDLEGFLRWLRSTPRLPFDVRIGGFRVGERPFESRRATPFERSFSIQGDKVVVVGWPVDPGDSGRFPDTLDALRREGDRFHVRHKYHRTADDFDNDFYFRIGLLQRPLRDHEQRGAEAAGRAWLAGRDPLVFEVGPREIKLASYSEETLPTETTRTWRLDQLPNEMSYLQLFE